MTAESIRSLDLDGWNAYKARTGLDLHVVIDGEDVTRRCFRAIFHRDSDSVGDVFLYRLNDAGDRYVDSATGKVATELRTGRLTIAPGAPLS